MTKHRSVVTGWDPTHVNPDNSTGRPKGVQTAPDMRIATTYDILAEGIFAKYGIPAITGSPTNTATISPFQAAIAAPNGGFYVVTIDANENFTINLSNVGAVKIYVQQQDYETDAANVDSNVVIGVVYGATAIPAGSLLLFTTTITNQTSTSGLTFTPAFKYTGAASGMIQVPTQSDLANIVASLITAGRRALVTTTGGGGTIGEYFYNGSAWQQTTIANPALESLLATGFIPVSDSWSFSSFDTNTRVGVITVPTGATSKYNAGMKIKISQSTGGVKYGFVTAVASTSLTVFFGPTYTLNNEAVSSPYYSTQYCPVGYDGPMLTKESYQSDTTNSQRWIYEQSGWGAMTFGSTISFISETVNLPVRYSAIPIINISAAGDQTSGTVALGNGGNTIHGGVGAKHHTDTVSSFVAFIYQAHESNWTSGNIVYYTWTARGIVG